MKMVRLAIAICITMSCLVVVKSEEAPSSAPFPATGCSSIIYDMFDCIPFISEGSKDKKPTASCCTGFKTVLKADDDCICEALKSSAQLGIDVNLSRAASLPSVCGVSAPPMGKCDVSLLSPRTAPGRSPITSPTTPPVKPPTIAPAKPPSPPSPAGAPSSSSNKAPSPSPAGAPSSSNISPPPSSGDEGDAKLAPTPALSSGSYSFSTYFSTLIIGMLVSISYVSV